MIYTDPNHVGTFTDDATFRAWGLKVQAALLAVGMVVTADTGQINWGTVLKPTVNNTAAGFEMYRFSDGLQATAPVFLKIEYGMGTANIPSLWLTVGTTTNGSGTITSGIIFSRKQIAPSTAGSGAFQLFASGDTSRLTLAVVNLNTQASGTAMWLSVERTKDVNGFDTADGVVAFCGAFGNGFAFQLMPFTGAAQPGQTSAIPIIFPLTAGLSIFGIDVAMAPPILYIGKVLYANCVLGYTVADIPAFVPVTATVLGTARTYMPLGVAFGSNTVSGAPSAGTSTIAMRYE